jgi:isoleucyl-tRNA synthetase
MKASLAAREPELLKMWDETRLYQQIKARQDRQVKKLAQLVLKRI